MTARLYIDQAGTTAEGGAGADEWAWLKGAACADADPDLFFPVGESDSAAEQVERAKAVCRSCSVESQCLEWALNTNRTSGVWGGTDEEERRRLRRGGRRRAPAGHSRNASAPGRTRHP